jgi:caa(3)-type oxidase subunit IV
MSGHDRKSYYKVFFALLVLTLVEVAVPYLAHKYKGLHGAYEAKLFFSFTPHWSSLALYLLSIVKAALVGLFFMHLKFETKWLKFIAILPGIAGFYAVVMCAEAFYRYFLELHNVAEPIMAGAAH